MVIVRVGFLARVGVGSGGGGEQATTTQREGGGWNQMISQKRNLWERRRRRIPRGYFYHQDAEQRPSDAGE